MKYSFFLLLFFTAVSTLESHTQDVNSFYFMRGVPQNYQVNPAFQPDCNFFIGLPGLAPLKVNADNSSFGLNDVFQYSSRIDSLVFFLHPDGIGGEEFLNRLSKVNSITTEFSTSLASFGFRTGDYYFTFDIRERLDAGISYSDDYIRFPIVGPDEGESFDMDLGIEATLLNEFSMGVSRKINDRLSVGVRGKLFFGQLNLNTEKLNIDLQTGEDAWVLGNDFSINTSAPFLIDYINFAVNAPFDVVFEDVNNFDPDPPSSSEIMRRVLNIKNFGLGLDLGADFRLTDKIQLSASLVDFGSVKWKDDMVNFKAKAEYTFEGVEVNLDDEDFGQSFSDSLANTFDNLSVEKTEYRNFLPAKLYLGGAYYLHPKISLGLLSRTQFVEGDIRQQFTASANLYPIRMISTTFSYSIINSTYKNIGFGLALKAFPFNFYLLTDTGPSVLFFPEDARYFNFKIGMNIMIGCQKKKKFDLPLLH